MRGETTLSRTHWRDPRAGGRPQPGLCRGRKVPAHTPRPRAFASPWPHPGFRHSSVRRLPPFSRAFRQKGRRGHRFRRGEQIPGSVGHGRNCSGKGQCGPRRNASTASAVIMPRLEDRRTSGKGQDGMASRSALTEAGMSGVPQMAETTATPSTPDCMTLPTSAALMPPMATEGQGARLTMSVGPKKPNRQPASPLGGRGPVGTDADVVDERRIHAEAFRHVGDRKPEHHAGRHQAMAVFRREIRLADMHAVSADGDGDVRVVVDEERHVVRGEHLGGFCRVDHEGASSSRNPRCTAVTPAAAAACAVRTKPSEPPQRPDQQDKNKEREEPCELSDMTDLIRRM